jgi:DNA-binding response OmpR family regulator
VFRIDHFWSAFGISVDLIEVCEMAVTEGQTARRVLLVDDDEVVVQMMKESLESSGFEVIAAGSVAEALKNIVTETFQVLITDLHLPHAGDGFTVVSAMRHCQPTALRMLLSALPDVKNAMGAITLEADQIVVKPVGVKQLAEFVQERLLVQRPLAVPKESVSAILQRCARSVVTNWLVRSKQVQELRNLPLKDDERTGHLPRLIEDLVRRLNRKAGASVKDSDAICSNSAALHGELRYAQAYTPELLVHESRILQVALFETLKDNMSALDFSLLLPDVMTIADEVDAQLTQAMGSYMKLLKTSSFPTLTKVAAA